MIPFVDIKAQYAAIRDEIGVAIQRVLDSGAFILGEEVVAFEQEFAAYSEAKFGIGVNTGTSALHLALLAAGVGPGDEVITVAHTFVATVAAIGYTGAKTVLVDVDPETFNLDPAKLEQAITPRTKVIMPVHLYGRMAPIDQIVAIARKHNLLVIEDACQAHGATFKGKRAGSFGDMACFSFYPGKNLGAYGEGGLVTTSSSEFAERIRILRDWGAKERYHHDVRGYNFRLEGIQGAVLRVKLRHLEKWTESRISRGRLYASLLKDLPVRTTREEAEYRNVYHILPIFTPLRNELRSYLQERGISTNIHYPIPVHLQKGYQDLGYKKGDLPVSEILAQEELSLPMYAELSDAQVNEVCQAVQSFFSGKK